jgi:hypothetical protein
MSIELGFIQSHSLLWYIALDIVIPYTSPFIISRTVYCILIRILHRLLYNCPSYNNNASVAPGPTVPYLCSQLTCFTITRHPALLCSSHRIRRPSLSAALCYAILSAVISASGSGHSFWLQSLKSRSRSYHPTLVTSHLLLPVLCRIIIFPSHMGFHVALFSSLLGHCQQSVP